MRYTVIALVDGQRIGGQSDATIHDVRDLMTDERGLDQVFMDRLLEDGRAVSVETYKVFEWDEVPVTSVLVAFRNQ